MHRGVHFALLACCALAGAGGGASLARAEGSDAHFRVIDASGAPIADAVIALRTEGALRSRPAADAVMDQRGKQFAPHVLAVRAGTLVHFPNSDQIRHQVYSFSPAKPFELRLYGGVEAPPIRFDVPGKVVLGCNIHDAMLGYVYVLDTDYFAVTGADGAAQIPAPPESYQVEVLHPDLADGALLTVAVPAPLTEALTLRLPGALPASPAPAAAEDPLQALFRSKRK
jgi:plastocyanin